VQDVSFARGLRDDLLAEMKHSSRRIGPSVWRRLNIFNWLVMRVSYTLARLLAGVLVDYKGRDDI
jgi:hypothetical protein